MAEEDYTRYTRSDKSFEQTDAYELVATKYPGGRIMSFGLGNLYTNAAKEVHKWGKYKESMACFVAVMTTSNSPGIFLNSGVTASGKTSGLGAHNDALVDLLPQLDESDPQQKLAVENRKGWGRWAKVNHRMCHLIWLTAVDCFAGKNVFLAMDTWVSTHGTLDEIASKTMPTEVEIKSSKKIETEYINITHARMVTNYRAHNKVLKEELFNHIVPMEFNGQIVNVHSLMEAQRLQAESKAKGKKKAKGGP